MTNDAIIVICTIILILLGIWFLINDINKFENATTLVRATHITNVTDKLLVTAKAEQMPKICNVIGFSSIRGLTKTCLYALRFIIQFSK